MINVSFVLILWMLFLCIGLSLSLFILDWIIWDALRPKKKKKLLLHIYSELIERFCSFKCRVLDLLDGSNSIWWFNYEMYAIWNISLFVEGMVLICSYFLVVSVVSAFSSTLMLALYKKHAYSFLESMRVD